MLDNFVILQLELGDVHVVVGPTENCHALLVEVIRLLLTAANGGLTPH